MAFLQMLKKLHDKGIKFNACVIGSGKNENKLKLFAKENLPINQIEFTGLIPHEEVIRKMLQSRCLVHTSLYEGNSTVISEAAYCGAWVICQKNHFTGNHPNIIYYNDLKNLAMEAEKVIRNDKPGVFGIQEPDMLQSATRFLELFQ
jgi:glycosyltransferase involved in cell wall biosynthesis